MKLDRYLRCVNRLCFCFDTEEAEASCFKVGARALERCHTEAVHHAATIWAGVKYLWVKVSVRQYSSGIRRPECVIAATGRSLTHLSVGDTNLSSATAQE